MPELPDIELYRSLLTQRLDGQVIEAFKVFNPFILRSVSPIPADVLGKRIVDVRRLGKRIVLEFEGEIFLVIHLMIAGRFRWFAAESGPVKPLGKITLATFSFPNGTLMLTEAGSKKRASLMLVKDEDELAKHDPGGIDVLTCSNEGFHQALIKESHTVKDALSNPHLFSGIGNAYSDEILFRAKLSPLKRTRTLSVAEVNHVFESTQSVLNEWILRLEKEFGDRFPGAGDVTAFRPEFAVHGKFGQPCPVCGKPVQRIRYADNETNYCAVCQNGGKILADRAMSRLLKGDFPRKVED